MQINFNNHLFEGSKGVVFDFKLQLSFLVVVKLYFLTVTYLFTGKDGYGKWQF